MEIKYTKTFAAKDRTYTAGEINAALGFAMEIYELRPALTEGKLGIGEICVLLFGITRDEYALRDSDPQKFAKLAADLRKNVPQDRLIGTRVIDLKGAPVQREIRVRTGASMDNGAFVEAVRKKNIAANAGPIDAALLECARLQKLGRAKDAPEGVKQDWLAARQRLGAAILTLETLTVADDALLNGRFPSVGFDGRVEIFTTAARAERVRAKVREVNLDTEMWSLRTLTRAEFTAFFKRCAELGLPAFRVDNGFAAAELQMDDLMSEPTPENAILRGHMLREIEYGIRWNKLKEKKAPEPQLRGALESMLSFRNFAWREAGAAILYAACVGIDADGGALCTQSARTKIDPDLRARVVSADQFMIVTDNAQKRYMAVFTSRILAAAFTEKRGANAEPVAMTFDDLKARMNVCDGVIIDVETFAYRIAKEQADQVLELRGKPPMAVRIQPPKPEAPSAPAPEKRADLNGLPNPDTVDAPVSEKRADLSGLPNPDAVDAPVSERSADTGGLPNPDAVDAPVSERSADPNGLPNPDATDPSGSASESPSDVKSEPTRESTTEKKGFFRKLFGKN